MLSVEVQTPKLGKLSKDNWIKFTNEFKTYKNRGGTEQWMSLIDPRRMGSLKAMYLAKLDDYEEKLNNYSIKFNKADENLEKAKEEYDSTDSKEKTKKDQLKKKLEKLEGDVRKYSDKILSTRDEMYEELWAALNKAFGSSTKKDFIDSVVDVSNLLNKCDRSDQGSINRSEKLHFPL
ncbi:hypothetical protein ADUPG1_013185 [Aduncisulcus paluster]|uniref:Uncharacterized protein n=1 Tax=Aduncisulcus paluster TaxID=2918883 RepID=A0ABQ5K230_9EUKA|nr:hypothetical protein ADUPG1_013185 [Aduncisulcus paluster]